MLKWSRVQEDHPSAGRGQRLSALCHTAKSQAQRTPKAQDAQFVCNRLGLATICAVLLCCLLLTGAALAESTTLTFSFAGDVTLGCDEDWWDDDRAFPNVAEPQGYDYPFAKVQHLFAADDLTIVNLEGVLQDGSEGMASGRKYNFRGPARYTGFLTHGSIEAVTLGNNHMGDFGRTGLASTKAALDAAGVGWMHNDTPFIFEKNGIRVAFLGYLQDAFYDRMERLPEIVRQLKDEEGCAAVVMNLHIGVEYETEHHRTQRVSAAEAIAAGVDLVIMHHPHVVQGVAQFHNRYVVYSLGNFCFGGNRFIRAEQYPSLVAVVTMTFEDGVYAGQQMTLHPMHCTGAPGNNYQPVPVSDGEAQQVMAQIAADTDFDLPPYQEGQGVQLPYLPAEEIQ